MAKALAAIKERMSETNVLDEIFSVFTSKLVTPHAKGPSLTFLDRYPDVRDIQLGVLMKHCRSLSVRKAFPKVIAKYGSMSHAEPVFSAFYDKLVA